MKVPFIESTTLMDMDARDQLLKKVRRGRRAGSGTGIISVETWLNLTQFCHKQCYLPK